MKIVNILGGLGNQMFQYAFALKLKYLFPYEEVKIYTKAFRGYHLHNGYELNKIFNVILQEATIKEVSNVYWPIFNYTTYRVSRYFLSSRKGYRDSFANPISINDMDRYSFYDGYFQNIIHYSNFAKELIEYMKFPDISDERNLRALEFINNIKTSSLHVRRGDYIGNSKFGNICNIDYYKKALQLLKEESDTQGILIFSNDIAWTKANLSRELKDYKTLFVEWNQGKDSYRDIQLMTLCNNNVIANSSFSWWGAFLNNHPDKIVISPSRWINSEKTSIIPNSWIKLQV